MNSYRKYLWAFAITLVIFVGVSAVSSYFDQRRLAEVRSINDSISLDILSSETQFDLLKQTPCEYLGDSSLSRELDSLGARLDFLEKSRGADDAQVMALKLNYSLLEIKDFLLMQSMSEKCRTKPAFVLYFYSNKGDCPDCAKAGAVLTALREAYPDLRVYSFDYHADAAAVGTLEDIYKVRERFPAFVVHGKPVYGLKSVADMEELMPELAVMKAAAEAAAAAAAQASSTATSTKK